MFMESDRRKYEFVSQAFKKDKVLLIYKCGSHAFGT